MDEEATTRAPWCEARAIWALIRDSAYAWSRDRASRHGAALAYYMAFSLAPILIVAIAMAGLVFGDAVATGRIFGEMTRIFGSTGARVVEAMVLSAARPGDGTLPTILAVLTSVIGATSALAELKDSLDQIWESPPDRFAGFWRYLWDFAHTRLTSIAIILGLGLLLLVSLVLSALTADLGHRLGVSDLTDALLRSLNFLLSLALVTVLFATLYKVLPAVQLAWRDVTIGAAVTAVLFTIGRHLIGLYLGRSAITSMYGAAGSLLVVLIWVYYSAQILLYGAEFTKIYATRFGSLRGGGSACQGG
ncbi:MAG TPA: YihY/virulence factor BrkB family protein [Steroidobacteraceae bacterium]|nr:YihY/virulence factor BrkB family protein [Steroidobacteraceae bacterium]